MSDLISREALIETIGKLKVDYYVDMNGKHNPIEQANKIINCIEDAPTVEAVPKSYAEQIRWERNVAVGQLNEIGCQFGQKMDEVKEKLETLQWTLCSELLPDGCDDAELEVLAYTEEKYIEAEFKEVGFALYYPGEKKFRSVYNHRADITENVVAWMYKPEPYKGE